MISVLNRIAVPIATLVFAFLSVGCGDENANYGKLRTAIGTASNSVQSPQFLQIDSSGEHRNLTTIRLSIISEWENDTAHYLQVRSVYEGKEVGFRLALPSSRKLNTRIGEGIAMQSTGQESDQLLQLLAGLYRHPLDKSARFADRLEPLYIDNKILAATITVSTPDTTGERDYKLFLKRNEEPGVAVISLYTSPDQRWLELRETDTTNRQDLIRLLGQPVNVVNLVE
jgi:hypothetical protein